MFWMNILLFSVTHLLSLASDEIPRPRGVSLSRAPLYKPQSDTFTCLDGSLTIPWDHVNDDYCDCPDASDEPGTAACAHGQFHCANAGHRPLNIVSSRVNDGICDCCDGSDEYHPVRCANMCGELGKTARAEARRQAELLKAGRELRAELAAKGAQLKKAKRDELAELGSQKFEAEKVLLEKDTLKKDIETHEAAALAIYKTIEDEEKCKQDELQAIQDRNEAIGTFNKLDANRNGLLEINELQSRAVFDTDRNGEITAEEARYYLGLVEEPEEYDSIDSETFVASAWSRVKPVMLIEGGLFKGRGTVEEVPLTGRVDDPEDVDEEDLDQGDVDDGVEDSPDDGEGEYADNEDTGDVGGDDVDGGKYDETTQRLVDRAEEARKIHQEADRNFKNIQSEIGKLEEYLQKDFGPEDEFATLEGQCFDYHDYEYIYRLCPFDKATQQQKSSSSETRLGKFAHWLHAPHLSDMSNKNSPSSSNAPHAYTTMLYDHGQSCWNGPNRSVRVDVTCGGAESRLVAVAEPNRCEYRFEFETPAACRDGGDVVTDGGGGGGGDEEDATAGGEYHDEL